MLELQAMIEGLAERVHRAVAIDDPKIHLLAHTAHDEKVDDHRIHSIMTLQAGPEIMEYVFGLGIRTRTGVIRIPRREDLHVLARVCIPIRCQDILLGYLWLIDDDESLAEDQLLDATRVAAAAGEILFRNQLLDDLRRAREKELLFDLVNDDPAGREHLSAEALDELGLDPAMGCLVLVVSCPPAQGRGDSGSALTLESTLRRGLRKLPRVSSLVATRRGGWGYALLAFRPLDDPSAQLAQVISEIRDELVGALPDAAEVLVGIGPSVSAVSDASVSFRRARGALEVCRAVGEFPPVTAWGDLGIYQVLNHLPVAELADIAIPSGLRVMLQAGADSWLVDTLDTYLDTAGNVQESAKRLHVHRATLYYRLSRIEELTGMSLADGRDRLALHLGIKVARLLGEVPAAEAKHSSVRGDRGRVTSGE